MTKEQERRMIFARQEAAKAWCQEKTSDLVMCVELAEEFAKILMIHMYEPHLGCATTSAMEAEILAREDRESATINSESSNAALRGDCPGKGV